MAKCSDFELWKLCTISLSIPVTPFNHGTESTKLAVDPFKCSSKFVQSLGKYYWGYYCVCKQSQVRKYNYTGCIYMWFEEHYISIFAYSPPLRKLLETTKSTFDQPLGFESSPLIGIHTQRLGYCISEHEFWCLVALLSGHGRIFTSKMYSCPKAAMHLSFSN